MPHLSQTFAQLHEADLARTALAQAEDRPCARDLFPSPLRVLGTGNERSHG